LKSGYFKSVACFCLSLAMAAAFSRAMAADADKEIPRGLSHYIAAFYYDDLGDIDKAIPEYRKALQDDPQSSLLHLNLAAALIKKNDIPPALEELKRAAELDPDAVEPHAMLALVYTMQSNEEMANREYELALKNASRLEPENTDIYKSLGAVYLQQGKLKEAEGVFKIVTGLSSGDEQAHFYLGNIYYDLGDLPASEKEIKAAIKIKPDYHEALNFLGYSYLEQNRNIDQAGRLIKKALGLQPDNGAYIDSLGWFYFRKGKFKEALRQLEKASSLLSDPVIYDHLGDVFMKLGNPEGARANWEKSLKMDPSQEQVKNKLSGSVGNINGKK